MDWITAVALAGLIVGLFAWLRADIGALRKDLRGEMAAQGTELRRLIAQQGGELARLAGEVSKLRKRMARMEGLLEGLREAVAGRHAA